MVHNLPQTSGAVTVLVDNSVMELVPDSAFVQRLSKPSTPFLAEHGFAALIEAGDKKILVDTGSTGIALRHNLSQLGLAAEDLDLVFLSHGHYDHTGGLDAVRGTVIAHPDAFCQRFLVPKAGVSIDLTGPRPSAGHRLQCHREPVVLAAGVITTGEIERVHEWEELPSFRIRKEGGEETDRIWDDQAVIIHSRNGLVIVAGCSHAGIVNTIKHAMKITGITKIAFVLGGFHLIGPGEAKIDRTIEELQRLDIERLVPIHCTGFEGTKRLSAAMPDRFAYCTAGCRIAF
ncbi:MAG: MBL fold metallo-hydrolase [Thermodesulfobacteriota bacterium]